MSELKNQNVVWQKGKHTKIEREKSLGRKGCIIWFTGLPCSGKSTIARELEMVLVEAGYNAFVLDGDNIRHGLNRNLGFSPEDRHENIRRIGEVARLFFQATVITITSFISPYRKDRNWVRSFCKDGEFIEIFCDCPLEECESRDVKGMYARARSGEILEYTGISAPYEPPLNPEIVLNTKKESIRESTDKILNYLKEKKFISDVS
ncbi:MAG: adenylyl-sulfate kinase [Thermodesulfobacteriota bacterium]|nr:adenylyl-sulfate kinase [Thermodesulfobacteriota bacterium]